VRSHEIDGALGLIGLHHREVMINGLAVTQG